MVKYFLVYLAVMVAMEVLACLLFRHRTWPTEYKKETLGCTCVPDGNWGECCWAHDDAYRSGGYFLDRWKADVNLLKCSWDKNRIASVILFIGVRHWPWAFTWGPKRKVVFTARPPVVPDGKLKI